MVSAPAATVRSLSAPAAATVRSLLACSPHPLAHVQGWEFGGLGIVGTAHIFAIAGPDVVHMPPPVEARGGLRALRFFSAASFTLVAAGLFLMTWRSSVTPRAAPALAAVAASPRAERALAAASPCASSAAASPCASRAACTAAPRCDPPGLDMRRLPSLLAPFVFPQLWDCARPKDALPTKVDHPSQSHEDSWIYDQFYATLPEAERYGHFFVELGAFDGISGSNTYWFEKALDWRGLLIEGHPTNSPLMRSNVMDGRKSSVPLAMSICGLVGVGDKAALGTLNFTKRGEQVGAAADLANPRFLDVWHKGVTEGLTPVDCAPLQSLLDIAGLRDVDLLSLDVEGAELVVLKTIDWTATNIRIVFVELDNDAPDKDAAVRAHLIEQGFEAWPRNPREACAKGEVRLAFGPRSRSLLFSHALLLSPHGSAPQDCTMNEAFINPRFNEVRDAPGRARPRRHRLGTGVACE